jgi:hypothetical protein
LVYSQLETPTIISIPLWKGLQAAFLFLTHLHPFATPVYYMEGKNTMDVYTTTDGDMMDVIPPGCLCSMGRWW